MFILVKVPDINPLTNEKDGELISMLAINPMDVKQIIANPKDGTAIIQYKIPSPDVETCIPFVSLFSELYQGGLVNVRFVEQVKSISNSFNNYIQLNHGL